MQGEWPVVFICCERLVIKDNMKTTGHSSAWDDVRIIYRENNWKILENSLNDDLTKIKSKIYCF